MSVKSCTFDTNVRKISGVVLMHVYRVEKIEVALMGNLFLNNISLEKVYLLLDSP